MVRAVLGFPMHDQPFVAVFHWQGSRYFNRMTIGTPGELRKEWDKALELCPDSIVVIKAFPVSIGRGKEMLGEWEQQWCSEWTPAGWAVMRDGLRRWLEEAPCETLFLQKLIGPENSRIKWKPFGRDRKELMQEARLDEKLPPFVVNGRSYVLWAIADYEAEGIFPTSKQIAEHKANSGFYKQKTIYNEIGELLAENRISKNAGRQVGLTDAGANELDWLEKSFDLSRRKNPRTLRIV